MIENSNRIQSILSNIIDKVEIIKNDFYTNGESHYDYILEKLKSAEWDLTLMIEMAKEEKKKYANNETK